MKFGMTPVVIHSLNLHQYAESGPKCLHAWTSFLASLLRSSRPWKVFFDFWRRFLSFNLPSAHCRPCVCLQLIPLVEKGHRTKLMSQLLSNKGSQSTEEKNEKHHQKTTNNVSNVLLMINSELHLLRKTAWCVQKLQNSC